VIAHRGAHESAPENTLPAYRASVALGVEYAEVDVRTTADGELVCHHNGTVDARTNGTGRVRDLTLPEIRALDAGSWFDSTFAGTRVPTADEALSVLLGRVAVYLDVKDVPPERVVRLLQKHGIVSKTVIYGGTDELLAMRALDRDIRPMPEYPGSPEQVPALAEALRPDVIAISSPTRTTPEAVAACHAVGALVFVDAMGADDVDGWAQIVDAGADGIQTDRPTALMAFLRERGLRE
jgi:glycerophosphoryl diester phosphodiesterase